MSDSDAYKARMQRKKAHINQQIAKADIDQGVVVVLTGNGKGKSSSALGMICRALGYGMQVALVQFLKGEQETGEDLFLSQQVNVRINKMSSGFTWESQDQDRDKELAQATWTKAQQYLNDSSIDLVVLDELSYMLNYHYLETDEVVQAIQNRPPHQHVVITGRAASEALIQLADTVSDIQDKKHAFRAHIKAQKGIDF